MKTDIYAEVTARIVAELERGAAPWVKPWSATAGQRPSRRTQPAIGPTQGCNVILLWFARKSRVGHATISHVQAGAGRPGGHVRKGEHGTKVYFVKQLQVKVNGEGQEAESRLIPMLREGRPG